MVGENDIPVEERREQISLFDMAEDESKSEAEEAELSKERALQQAMLEIKHKYGKNAVVKAKNLNKGGTAIERNGQIGGHKA